MARCKSNDKAEWIKVSAKNLYEWHKGRKIMHKKGITENIDESNGRENKRT